ncbi:MAG TPA: trigger factor [Oscillospiraceae bacterium]|nr:trigger factor [Oscillospiraceae bacterium]
MSSEIVKKEKTRIVLKLAVEYKKFDEAINEVYSKTKSRFNIQGFRKGKAPRRIIERYYGPEIFYEDAVEIVFPEAYEAALEEHNIEPVDHPAITIEEVNKDGNVVFTVIIEVMPEFEVTGYKGIEVEKKEYNVQEEDIQKEIDALLQQNARMIAVEDRAVQGEDLIIFDYKGMIDGVPFEGGSAEKWSLTVGSNQFIPGFEDQLIGKKIGEKSEVEVTFPEDYHAKDLAGKDAVFEVIIHEIKEKEIPKLDDEFVKDVSEFDTLDELKDDIRATLEKSTKSKAEQELRNSIIEHVCNNSDIEMPYALVERQIDNMLMDFGYSLQYQGIDMEYYLQATGMSEEDLREKMREDAVQVVKNELVIGKIGEQENIEVTDEEIDEQVEETANQFGQDIEKIRSSLGEQGLKSIKESIIFRKTIDFLVENAKLV